MHPRLPVHPKLPVHFTSKRRLHDLVAFTCLDALAPYALTVPIFQLAAGLPASVRPAALKRLSNILRALFKKAWRMPDQFQDPSSGPEDGKTFG
jgi:hypothetical protein